MGPFYLPSIVAPDSLSAECSHCAMWERRTVDADDSLHIRTFDLFDPDLVHTLFY